MGKKRELWLGSEACLSIIYQIHCCGVAHTWGNMTPGMLLRSFLHCLSQDCQGRGWEAVFPLALAFENLTILSQ